MKASRVIVSDNVQKSLRKLPKQILILFGEWIKLIKEEGYFEMKKISGYRDHALKGNLTGKRSSSLTKSYRVIYHIIQEDVLIVNVIEVNKHDYKI